MTEADWLSCTDPGPMLAFLRGRVSERKSRLFAVACVKRVERFLREEEGRHALQVAERLTEGPVPKNQIRRAYDRASAVYWELIDRPGWGTHCPYTAALEAATNTLAHPWLPLSPPATSFASHFDEAAFKASVALATANATPSPAEHSAWESEVRAERRQQAGLLRDIIGNPFRPVSFNPAWLTPTVTDLAHTIYDERTFERLPVLADALEQAGCDDHHVLEHCRGPGPHVPGCSVVDALLAKS